VLPPPLSAADAHAHAAAHSVAPPPPLDAGDTAAAATEKSPYVPSGVTLHNAADEHAFSVTSAWRGSLCFVEGFYAPGLPLGVEALRAALRAVTRPPSTSLRVVDFWVTTALTLSGLTHESAGAIGFDPEVASAAASLADVLHIAPERMSVDHAEFTPSGWAVTLTATGFESRAPAVAAAAESLRSHATQAMLQRAFGGFFCGTEDCLDVTVSLGPPRVRAIAVAKPLTTGGEDVNSPLDAHRRLLNAPQAASIFTSSAI
jgi:hypothetical protein